jgi:hypothetical protein
MELASTLEVVVELRDTFVEKYPAEFINNTLSQAATDAICQRWKMIHVLPPKKQTRKTFEFVN